MTYKIAILAGDGIGPEVMREALKVLKVVEKLFFTKFAFFEAEIGGSAYDAYGCHFPENTQQICQQCDAILLGSIGGPISEQHIPKWKDCEKNALLSLRKLFGFYLNLRPIKLSPNLKHLSPIKEIYIQNGIDILCIRELIEDVYFGEHITKVENGKEKASDSMYYTEDAIERIAIAAFTYAKNRRRKVTSIDKANVLDTSKLWRRVTEKVAKKFPECSLQHMLVDNCAMQLIKNPTQFDVLLMPNLFGDILSDQASALTGSLGLIPSASLNTSGFGLYEPMGGSAQDIAGKNIANPIAQILSVALMLRYSFKMQQAALCIEESIQSVLANNIGTCDLHFTKSISTDAMGDAIVEKMLKTGG